MKPITIAVFVLISIYTTGQETDIVILNKHEIKNFRKVVSCYSSIKNMSDSVINLANTVLNDEPRPLEVIHYEGLLDTNPKRVNTIKSFTDIDNIVTLIYAGYCNDNPLYGLKSKEIILEWAKIYKPTGNTINENKFSGIFWAYYIYRKHFNNKEKEIAENWMKEIAVVEMNRELTPNNNWEAKRLKIIGIVGCILENKEFVNYSIAGFKRYISTAYYPDGTSNDLHRRDALHYHVSGLKPCLTAFINLSKFDSAFNLYHFEADNGASIKKSVEYVIPYATGEKQREEWKNTKVELDKKRAAAGLTKYQPGLLFDPKKAWSMLEWACYYNPKWYSVFENPENEKFTSSWVGLLNSPLVRN